ncbi:MAG: NTP transferase domain-containing protein [Nitrospirales bacterium]
MTQNRSILTAIVLAGSRADHDSVAEATGVPCKALAPVGNIPMVFRVLNALQNADTISSSVLCGPNWSIVEQSHQLRSRLDSQRIQWVAPQTTPCTSTTFAMQSISQDTPILITTADHALLTSEIVDYFCSHALSNDSDVVVGLVPFDIIQKAYPKTKRTVMRFKGHGYCGCNLFAFLSPQGRTIAEFWRQVEQERKNPLRLIRTIGWMAVLRYLTGQLSLEQGLEEISKLLSLKISAVKLPFPQAAIDVDTVADWELVQEILQNPTTQ